MHFFLVGRILPWGARLRKSDWRELARNKYRPDHIELLFIAEAPPANDSRRFFYFVPVDIGDTLFLEMMKVLYPKKAKFVEYDGNGKPGFNAKQVRNRKAEFLEKFKRDGFYLIDAVDEPMPKNATTKMKEERSAVPFPVSGITAGGVWRSRCASYPDRCPSAQGLCGGLAKGQGACSQQRHDRHPGPRRAEALQEQTSPGAPSP